MTLTRKSTRRITVEGVEYRWLVSCDDEPGLAIVVERAEFPKQRMVTWVEYGNIISPWLVRKAILHALSKGWQPHKNRKEMIFRFQGIVTRENSLGTRLMLRRYEEEDCASVWHLHNLTLDQVEAHRGNGTWNNDLEQIPTIYLNSGGEFVVGILDNQLITIGALNKAHLRHIC
ncbi:MAG: hypothetical protein NVS2B14_09690 [Chamaesiphon sp.]